MPRDALIRLRERYPEYSDLGDQELAARIVETYPEYEDLLGDVAAPKPQTFLQRIGSTFTGEVAEGASNLTDFVKLAGRQLLPPFMRSEEPPTAEPPSVGERALNAARVFKGPIGAAQLVGAPITALARPAAAKTVEVTGLPRWTEFPLEVGYSIPGGLGAGTALRAGKNAAQSGASALKRFMGFKPSTTPAAPPPPTAPPLAPPAAVPFPDVPSVPGPAGRAATGPVDVVPALPEVERATQASIPKLKERAAAAIHPDDRRVFLRFHELWKSGELGSVDPLAADAFKETISHGARLLNVMSRAKKALDEGAHDPQVASALQQMQQAATTPRGALDTVWDVVQRGDRVRRGMLVTQLATAARNAISQGTRYSLDLADNALTLALEGKPGQALGETLDGVMSVVRVMKPSDRAKLTEALEQSPADAIRLLSRSSLVEAGLDNKVVAFFNGFNRVQERFFQSIAFDSKLRTELSRRGLDLDTIAPRDIPHELIEKAVDHSLEVTFAKSAKTEAGKWLVQTFSQFPGSIVNPFPRFNFANALPFLFEFSPAGAAKLFSKEAIEQMASGNPEIAAKAISRAAIGTTMLAAGVGIRSDPTVGGEKWWEIRLPGGKVLDTRPFAPFSTYLLLGEALAHPERVTIEDAAHGVLGLNRIAGTGLAVLDLVKGTIAGEQGPGQALERLGGDLLGGFTTPGRTARDIIAGTVNPEEGVVRDVTTNPIFGPLLRNLPGASRTLPASQSPLKPGPLREESPLLRQLSGLSVKTKTPQESLVDRLSRGEHMMFERAPFPRTGIPEANLAIKGAMGAPTERAIQGLLSNPTFRRLTDAEQRLVLEQLFAVLRRGATATLPPEVQKTIKVRRLDKDVRDVLSERGVNIPGLSEMLGR